MDVKVFCRHKSAINFTWLPLEVTVPFGASAFLVPPYAPDSLYTDSNNPQYPTCNKPGSNSRFIQIFRYCNPAILVVCFF